MPLVETQLLRKMTGPVTAALFSKMAGAARVMVRRVDRRARLEIGEIISAAVLRFAR